MEGFLYLLDVMPCLDIGLYVARFAGMISNISSHTTEFYRDTKQKKQNAYAVRSFLILIF